jgi:hypothetical protein
MSPEYSNAGSMPPPANLTNAVETVANLLYLIHLKAEDAEEVRRCVALAAPAIEMLAVLAEKGHLL